MPARYTFDFISIYDGVSHYRMHRDGKDNGRFNVNEKSRVCYYSDGSGLYTPELDGFNDYSKAIYDRAVAKYGTEIVGEFIPYISA